MIPSGRVTMAVMFETPPFVGMKPGFAKMVIFEPTGAVSGTHWHVIMPKVSATGRSLRMALPPMKPVMA
jgi:hypothetical protein